MSERAKEGERKREVEKKSVTSLDHKPGCLNGEREEWKNSNCN